MIGAVTGETQMLHLVTAAAADGSAERATALAALTALRELRTRLDAWEPELIAAARAGGASWAELAPVLGVASRQAAERRYLRMREPPREESELTRDERVLAERDRRASDRAVTAWARANGADLRQLAGQITALTDLGPAAQPSLARLHQALGGRDPTVLIALLANAYEHLGRGHATLAGRVTAVADSVDKVRATTQRQRVHDRVPEQHTALGDQDLDPPHATDRQRRGDRGA